ncbi:facilitated trehalose transporter Tret1-like [Atheta coriaria]|uniref:facilitated trehalose transporter Tret1-like n=1 Tax=Dalotia coriaria TaxID=877792 RepID=UPI0031F396A9
MTGFSYGWPSPSIPKLLDGSHVSVTNDQTAWLAVINILFSIPGAVVAGWALDKIGRQKIILFLGWPNLIAWLLIAFSTRVEMLFIARAIVGFVDAFVFIAIPLYVGEIALANTRGLLGSLTSVSLVLGIAIINAIGHYLSIYTTALICAGLPIIYTILVYFAIESPYYHIMNDQHEDAKHCLRKHRGVEDVDDEFIRLATVIQEDQRNKGHFMDLFTVSSNRKALLIMCGLRTIQQFSGISAITFYTPKILTIDHIVVIYFGVQLFMTCIASIIVDKAGRRPLLILSSMGTGFASTVVAVYYFLLQRTLVDLSNLEYLPVIAMIMYIVLHSVGLYTIPLLMISEVFPTSVKSYAIAILDLYFCLCVTASAQFFYVTLTFEGMYLALFCFAMFSFAGTVFIHIFVPETKGKTLEDVVDHFKRR